MLARKSHKSYAAVAYFTRADGLPLRRGSILVVDASLESIRGGRTDPAELLKLIQKGVRVHSCSKLHSKVFVFDRRAIVGSLNISGSSMIEAAIETTERQVIKDARNFVLQHSGDEIGEEEARSLQREYRPAKYGRNGSPRPKDPGRIWLVPWTDEDCSDDALQSAERRARAQAKHRAQRSSEYEQHRLRWEDGDPFFKEAKYPDRILFVSENSAKNLILSPLAKILASAPVSKRREMVFIVESRRQSTKRFAAAKAHLSKSLTKRIRNLKEDAKLLPRQEALSAERLWK